MDMQLNISIPKKKPASSEKSKDSSGYSFVSRPVLKGTILARKRPQRDQSDNDLTRHFKSGPSPKIQKVFNSKTAKQNDMTDSLRELSENKGKYHGKDYQELNDELQVKQKPRAGGWISSLFKNNPEVPRMGQRAVKPLVEKVFTGKQFSDLDVHPHCVANLQQNLKLKELMTVQQKAVPIILQGRDVLVRSQTGSGKTLAYALPVIEGLQAIRPKINRHDGIRVVVVVPTRELALQTYELFIKLVKPFTWLVPGLLSGGQKRKAEKARLRKGLSILVGTPGRICDHMRHTQSLNFAKTRCLILDEADRLLDMGYEKDVAMIVKALEEHRKAATYDPMALIRQSVNKKFDDNEIEKDKEGDSKEEEEEKSEIKHHITEVFLSEQRQTILLSATLTKAIENLAGLTMVDPVFVDTSEGRQVVADSLKKAVIGGIESENIAKASHEKISPKVVEENTHVKVSLVKSAEELTTKKVKKKKKEVEEENEDEEVDDKPEEIRKGITQFNGLKFRDLFTPKDSKTDTSASTVKKAEKANVQQKNTEDNDSDSDSDYEYFKVQKEISVEKKKKEDTPEKEMTDENEHIDHFQEALQSAVVEDELLVPASVNQSFLITPMKLRLVTLCAIIVQHCVLNKKGGKLIVFMATQEMVDYHADLLEDVLTGKKKESSKKKPEKGKSKKRKFENSDNEDEDSSEQEEVSSDFEIELPGVPTEGGLVLVELDLFRLHGSMPHETRMRVFKEFRTARSALLLCTDVAARGIDVPHVDLVLQYCAPASATDYVHRVGRTGRAAHVGAATLLLLPSEAPFVRYLEEKRVRLRQTDDRSVLESLRSVAPGAATAPRAAVTVQAALEKTAHSSKEWLASASRAYQSWVRFYSGYPRSVREYLDSRQLHLGHAAKAFALRDAPGTLARRVKNDPNAKRPTHNNKFTVTQDQDRKRQGFPKLKLPKRAAQPKQSSMHTASEFDSGLEPLHSKKKSNKNKM